MLSLVPGEDESVLRRFTVYMERDDDEMVCTGQIVTTPGEPIVCENCNADAEVYSIIWIQGTRPTPPDEPDTMVICECLPCFITYPDAHKIVMED